MDINDLHKGSVIMINGEPFRVSDHTAVKPGKGTAFARCKLKSLTGDKVIDATFKAGENIEGANISHRDAQYLYNDGTNYYFMLDDNFEQHSIDSETLGDKIYYFQEEMKVTLVFLDTQPIDVKLPNKMDFKISQAPPGVKGNTSTTANHIVTIETGLKVTVPIFVKEGDVIRLNTETGKYDSRVS